MALSARWKNHIEAWQASGLSQAEYCRRHGLNANTLVGWGRRQPRRAAAARGLGPCAAAVHLAGLAQDAVEAGLGGKVLALGPPAGGRSGSEADWQTRRYWRLPRCVDVPLDSACSRVSASAPPPAARPFSLRHFPASVAGSRLPSPRCRRTRMLSRRHPM